MRDIQGLRELLYADDITLWVTQASPGQIQDTLQVALDALQTAAAGMGLLCSPEKSSTSPKMASTPDTSKNRPTTPTNSEGRQTF
ncbi:hypothetical protein HPB48_011156 [Haemaphysalis longicornis]|uniref:Reverse transcriptase domain-containing protein n=1 Tax=Haemaphysalis longicornis TaxID=44386 RepID=A0A9J6FRW0_HAELO|nr:hypothetical protein HPB48_011156 [Haemaphysalis longicornis]